MQRTLANRSESQDSKGGCVVKKKEKEKKEEETKIDSVPFEVFVLCSLLPRVFCFPPTCFPSPLRRSFEAIEYNHDSHRGLCGWQ